MMNRDGDGLLDFDVSLREGLLLVPGYTLLQVLEWGVGTWRFPAIEAAPIAIAAGGVAGAVTFGLGLRFDRVLASIAVGACVMLVSLYVLGMHEDPVKELATVAFLWTSAGIPFLIVLVYERRTADPDAPG